MDAVSEPANVVEIDDLQIDLDERCVRRDGEPLAVTARSFELLRFLIERHPQIAAPRTIIAAVWPDSVVSGDALTQRVRLLRRQLGGSGGRYIASVHGLGYRLAAAPRRRPASTREPSPPNLQARRWPAAHPVLTAALAATLALGIIAGGVLIYDPPHALKHALKHRLGGAGGR